MRPYHRSGGRIPRWKTLVQLVVRNKTSLRVEQMRGVSTHGRSRETRENSGNKTLYSCPGDLKHLCLSGPVLCRLHSVHLCVLPAPSSCSSILLLYCLAPPWPSMTAAYELCDKGALCGVSWPSQASHSDNLLGLIGSSPAPIHWSNDGYLHWLFQVPTAM